MTIHRRTKPGANGIGTGCDSRGMEVIIGGTVCLFLDGAGPGILAAGRGCGWQVVASAATKPAARSARRSLGANRYTVAGRELRRFARIGLTPFAFAWGRRQYAGKSVD
jgi:hypothetical protein